MNQSPPLQGFQRCVDVASFIPLPLKVWGKGRKGGVSKVFSVGKYPELSRIQNHAVLLCLALILQAPPLTFLVKSSDTAEAFPTQQHAENRKCNCREKIQLQTMPSKLPHAAGTGCRTREGSKEKGRLAQRIRKLIKRLVFQRAQSKLLGARTNPKKPFLAVSLITRTAKHRWFLRIKQTLFKAPSVRRTQNNDRTLADGRMRRPNPRGEEVLGVPVPRFPAGQTHRPPRRRRWQ